MVEKLITFETAKLAKDKGFNIPTRHFYADLSWNSEEIYKSNEVGYDEFTSSMENDHGFGDIVLIPTQSLLQKWLRDSYHIDVLVGRSQKSYCIFIYDNINDIVRSRPLDNNIFDDYNVYEDALEKGLQEALKLI